MTRRYMVMIGLEAPDIANPPLMEVMIKGLIEDLKAREWVGDYGIHVRELKDGEVPTMELLELGLPKMGES